MPEILHEDGTKEFMNHPIEAYDTPIYILCEINPAKKQENLFVDCYLSSDEAKDAAEGFEKLNPGSKINITKTTIG